jgi:phage baseplate assembly protein W
MIGMNARTGRAISGQAHLEQSITDILFTPIGTRVMRRDYGSLLPQLIDGPMNPVMRMRVMAATVMALARWEPRIEVTKVEFSASGIGGAAVLEVQADRVDGLHTSESISLRIPTPTARGFE